MTMKLPTDNRPLVRDPDLAAALEAELTPYSGDKLKKAQDAIRRVRQSALQGPFSTVFGAYRTAIEQAVKEKP